MNFLKRRQQLFDQMEENAALILFSGIETHVSADEYAPFEANRNFFYLTGLRRERMILLMKKTKRDPKEILFIEEADPTQERWYGRKVTVDEAKEISQIEDVRFLESFDGVFDMMMTREDVKSLYFDCYRHQQEDLPDYNAVKAKEYAALYPGHPIRNLFPYVVQMRMQKDADEVAQLKTAIGITDNALQYVMKHLEPGMAEYQAQADFEYQIM